jgi:hypothetical protein
MAIGKEGSNISFAVAQLQLRILWIAVISGVLLAPEQSHEKGLHEANIGQAGYACHAHGNAAAGIGFRR